jgi:MscS family membrane protein
MTILCLLFLWICGSTGGAAQDVRPLAPPDTSSPRATLKTFLDNMNNGLQAYRSGHKQEAATLVQHAARCLNLEKEPLALRYVMGFYSSLYLKETLDSIEIPADDEIPDAKAVRAENISSWVIPCTEITIAPVKDGSSIDRFLFTSDTVRNAEHYYEKVKNLPYRPGTGGRALLEQLRTSGSLIASVIRLSNLSCCAGSMSPNSRDERFMN